MFGKMKKIAAAFLIALVCIPLAACGTVVSKMEIGGTPEFTVTVRTETSEASDTSAEGGSGIAETDVRAASVWDGDLEKAGWGSSAAEAPDDYAVDGTKKTVTIGSAEALAYFSHQVYASADGFAGYTATLTCDVDLNNELWMPIGFAHRKEAGSDKIRKLAHGFKGIFDGGNHTVYNFSAAKFLDAITATGTAPDQCVYSVVKGGVNVPLYTVHEDDGKITKHYYEFHYGLFGATGNATVKNLNINTFEFDFKSVAENADKDEKIKLLIPDSVAALIGYAAGSITVENCTVGNAETASRIIGTDTAAGIIGRAYPGYDSGSGAFDKGVGTKMPMILNNCVSYVDIGYMNEMPTSQGSKKGGIVAYAYWLDKVEFVNCVNYGDLYGTYLGGMISYIQDGNMDFTMSGCKNYGDIYQFGENASGKVIFHTGGIMGRLGGYEQNEKSVVIADCENHGNVIAKTGESAGGIMGQLSVKVSASGAKFEFVRCFNYGNVELKNGICDTSNGKISSVGGVLGHIGGSGINLQLGIGNCGRVTGGGTVKGCIGKLTGTYTKLYEIDGYEMPNA